MSKNKEINEHNLNHSNNHSHGHTHDHAGEDHHRHRKSVVNRLARIEGHVRSVKDMAANGRECGDLLIQIAAIRSALDNCGKLILKDHLEGCVIEAAKSGTEQEVMKQLNEALDKFIR
ncbi:metal-sensing transcriptional repressor [Paenibacillus sp. NPDC056579]|uniref:metal-sensing transcriptional repressor n=1 Tax=unclassified Paenibacillus TaxID=185978 RepID=UPI001EF98FF5|nr:metal-sensing transcriptional repressor [Paenibacillus sp. H1-7]ULL16692.1 transcriptional regulator [Paenibacillus sp. H1-7]